MDVRAAAPAARQYCADVAVIGGGIVGLGIAWELQRTGRSVTVIDPAPASGATFAAAGMLAAVCEFHYQEEDLLALTLASAALWPSFIERLASAGVPGTGFTTTATLVAAADAADRRALAELRTVQRAHGLEVEPLALRDARAREPLLAPQVCAAFEVSADHQVDPRALAAALLAALELGAAGQDGPNFTRTVLRRMARTVLHEDPADDSSPVTGVQLDDGSTVQATEVIVANGLGAAALDGLPAGLLLPLRPVYGDILRLRVPEHLQPLVSTTIRGLVHGQPIYIVPRADGTVVIGATSREDGTAGVSAGGVYQLLRDAQALVPAVAELELLESTARARPGTPDNAPLLGRVASPDGTDISGLILATGFFRHGVLLTPVAAETCRQLANGITDLSRLPFRPDRFSPGLHPTPASSRPVRPKTAKELL